MPTKQAESEAADKSKTSPDKAAANLKTESKDNKAQQDEFLQEGLEESFPGSDPIASMRFTSE